MADPNLEDFTDLVKSVRTSRDVGTWVDATTDLQKYHALPRIRNSKNVELMSSYQCDWDVNFDTAGNAVSQSTLADDVVVQTPTMQTASMNLRHQQTAYTYTLDQIMANGGGSRNRDDATRLWNFLQKERHGAWVDFADLIETTFWGTPSSSSDTTTPFGLLHGVCAAYDYTTGNNANAATTAAGAFQGTVPNTNWTTVYGINPTTHTRHANWTHQYVNVTRDDLIYKMKQGMYKTNFMPPVAVPKDPGLENVGFYSNFSVVNDLENKLEDRNENLGTDLNAMGGKTRLKRAPFEVVPQLDSDSTNPVYQVDWGKVEIKVLRGMHFRESDPQIHGSKHLVMLVFVDLQWGVKIENRRAFAAYTL